MSNDKNISEINKKTWRSNIFIPIGILFIGFLIIANYDNDFKSKPPLHVDIAIFLNIVAFVWLVLLAIYYFFKLPFIAKITNGIMGIISRIIFGLLIFYMFLVFLDIFFAPGFMMGPSRFGV